MGCLKHVPPRNAGGVVNRIKKLYIVCSKEKWTSKAPLAREIPLKIRWLKKISTEHIELPEYISEQYI